MKIILTLGCWGREKDGFISCSGAENKILDLTNRTKKNIEIENMLDFTYKLFDKPLYNNIHTALWNIQEKFSDIEGQVFNKELFKLIEEFCIAHSKCGVFLKLELYK